MFTTLAEGILLLLNSYEEALTGRNTGVVSTIDYEGPYPVNAAVLSMLTATAWRIGRIKASTQLIGASFKGVLARIDNLPMDIEAVRQRIGASVAGKHRKIDIYALRHDLATLNLRTFT